LKTITALGWLCLGMMFVDGRRIYGEEMAQITTQVVSLAPNAGGQVAYSLRYGKESHEWGLFSNTFLLAGDLPLTGAFYDWRFALCGMSCFWQFYLQLGAGASTGGPIAQITWAAIIPILPIWLPSKAPKYIPALRLDVTSQMIFVQYRGVTWSYPLWMGITVPI
jgi:hypothetical protein